MSQSVSQFVSQSVSQSGTKGTKGKINNNSKVFFFLPVLCCSHRNTYPYKLIMMKVCLNVPYGL